METEEAAKEEVKSAASEAKESKEESSGSPSGDKASEAAESNVEAEDGNSRDSNKTDVCDEEIPSDETKPKGVLVIHSQQRKRPKKSLRWREDHELETHHFFELDETERGRLFYMFFLEAINSVFGCFQ